MNLICVLCKIPYVEEVTPGRGLFEHCPDCLAEVDKNLHDMKASGVAQVRELKKLAVRAEGREGRAHQKPAYFPHLYHHSLSRGLRGKRSS